MCFIRKVGFVFFYMLDVICWFVRSSVGQKILFQAYRNGLSILRKSKDLEKIFCLENDLLDIFPQLNENKEIITQIDEDKNKLSDVSIAYNTKRNSIKTKCKDVGIEYFPNSGAVHLNYNLKL